MQKIAIGMKAPDFTADSTFGQISLSDFYGSWVVFFSHPGDFTPVCTSEFIAFSKAAKDFFDKNTQLLGLSTDSNASHLAWIYAIKTTAGIAVPFPVISDRRGKIAEKYEMISPHTNSGETERNVFIIDPNGIIRAILIYPPSTGRSVPEILRLLTALQTSDAGGVVTPANWQSSEAAMLPAPSNLGDLMRREEDESCCDDLYMCYSAKE